VQGVLGTAAKDLESRLETVLARRGGGDTFTAARLQATLTQVRGVIAKVVVPGMTEGILSAGGKAAESAGSNAFSYLENAHEAFAGTTGEILGIKEASLVSAATSGTRASILRRLASSGGAIAGAEGVSKGKVGILQRYGLETIGHFEGVLQNAILTRQPVDEVRDRLTEKSPFLMASPRFWAERIMRTEIMGAFSLGSWLAGKAADDELGDLVRILSATFDDRIGSDSIAVHGQVRRMGEPFESWFGPYMYPPNRPNDREIVVDHRISWGAPPEHLKPRSDGEIAAAWKREKRKGGPPPRPNMSTIDPSEWGRPPPKVEGEEEEGAAPEEEAEAVPEEEPVPEERPSALARVLPRRAPHAPRRSAKAIERATAAVDLLPEGEAAGTVAADFPTYPTTPGEAPWMKGLSAAERDVVAKAIAGDIPAIVESEDVAIDDLVLPEKEHSTKTLKRKIREGPDTTDALVIRKNGQHFAESGDGDLLARSMLGHAKAKVDVLDLDAPKTIEHIKGRVKQVKVQR
jgi:hypothetical protein